MTSRTTEETPRIAFVHLDWGIGGAEQLMLQLVQASLDNNFDKVELYTTRCEPHHCFASLRPGGGHLYNHLHVWGRWIPSHIFGRFQALLSTIRLIYLSYWVSKTCSSANLIVTDVLPTSLWVFSYCLPSASTLYYCHFPDQLLTRNKSTSSLRTAYRKLLDSVEESSMSLADTIALNSHFTKQVVLQTFPSLQDRPLPVLYPALEVSSDPNRATQYTRHPNLVVSLNRFERKKNLELLLRAAAWIQEQQAIIPLQVVIAGGYDTLNVENVEYRGELGTLVEQLQLKSVVSFRHSISDAEREQLLAEATVLVYTPSNEHFGIVPLESMYAETPVVACDSGGPKESVVNGRTGYLCEPTPAAFGKAISSLLQHPQQARDMGRAGKHHVLEKFGPQRLQKEWKDLVEHTLEHGRVRCAEKQRSLLFWMFRSVQYMLEGGLLLGVVWFITLILQYLGLLDSHQSILGGARRLMGHDEL